MKKIAVSSIPSSYVIITTLVYALLVTIFLELNNASGDEGIDIKNMDSDTKSSAQELVDASCKSPSPSDAEMCITMCA